MTLRYTRTCTTRSNMTRLVAKKTAAREVTISLSYGHLKEGILRPKYRFGTHFYLIVSFATDSRSVFLSLSAIVNLPFHYRN